MMKMTIFQIHILTIPKPPGDIRDQFSYRPCIKMTRRAYLPPEVLVRVIRGQRRASLIFHEK